MVRSYSVLILRVNMVFEDNYGKKIRSLDT